MNTVSSIEGHHGSLLRRVTYASVAVASLLIVIKLLAFFLTDSVALLSSLIDSVLDLFASLVNLVAVRQALVPADAEHRFGHGKAEPLAGLGQGAFITGSAVFLCFEAVSRIIQPVEVAHGTAGIAVMLVSLALTLSLVAYQRYVISRTGSLAVQADSIHYASDIAINASVIVALVLTVQLGWIYADPLFALGIAVYIIYAVWQIVKQSLNQLMDRELPDEDRARILAIASRHPEVHDAHDLRTRASGYNRFIQLHLEMDGRLPLAVAHRVAVEVMEEIQAAFPGADVIIHEDPAEEDEAEQREMAMGVQEPEQGG